MVLVLIDSLRYMLNSLFTFLTLNGYKKHSFIKIVVLSTIYTVFLTTFKLFVVDNQIVIAIYVLLMFGILIVINGRKNFKFSIFYSLFITCLTECIHFLFFGLFPINRTIMGIAEVTASEPKRLLISRIIVFLLYFVAISVVYIFKKVDIDLIIKFSRYKIFSIILSVTLCIVIGLKYCIKYLLFFSYYASS